MATILLDSLVIGWDMQRDSPTVERDGPISSISLGPNLKIQMPTSETPLFFRSLRKELSKKGIKTE